jgi:tRNA(Ser,Leu) C12 N-acetylase TAN1
MRDWNTVATLRGKDFAQATRTLAELGPVARTPYFNVLVLRMEAITGALEQLRENLGAAPDRFSFLGRLVPLTHLFNFKSAAEFEEQAAKAVLARRAELAGKSFHVRMHRRGFKGRLSSMEEEQFLDEVVVKSVREAGATARVSFEEPEVIIAVESVDQRGGLSVWSRQDLERYPFLGLD